MTTWSAYLDALEAAARELHATVLNGGTPVMPELDQPDGDPSKEDELRVPAVARLVAEAEAVMHLHQDAIRERLGALAHQPPRLTQQRPQSLGERLDVRG